MYINSFYIIIVGFNNCTFWIGEELVEGGGLYGFGIELYSNNILRLNDSKQDGLIQTQHISDIMLTVSIKPHSKANTRRVIYYVWCGLCGFYIERIPYGPISNRREANGYGAIRGVPSDGCCAMGGLGGAH